MYLRQIAVQSRTMSDRKMCKVIWDRIVTRFYLGSKEMEISFILYHCYGAL